MERYTPFSGGWNARYAECVGATDVADDCFGVCKGDDVTLGDDVMNAYEGCMIAVGDDGEWAETDGGYLFDKFSFHIAVTYGGAEWGRSNIVLPFWVGQEEAAGCGAWSSWLRYLARRWNHQGRCGRIGRWSECKRVDGWWSRGLGRRCVPVGG